MDELDMKSYAGEMDSAAESQPVDQNSYAEMQTEEYPVQEEFLDQQQSKKELIEEPSKQELNFKALREEIDRVKAEKDELRQNLEMMRANMVQKPQEPPPSRGDPFEGMEDHDLPSVGDIRRAWEQKELDYKRNRDLLEEMHFKQGHPDYEEVLMKFTAPLIKQKPHLAEGLQSASNKALYAYDIGKLAQLQQQQAEQAQSRNAARIVENARKPGTLSSAGGQGSLSKADYFASMSDAEFMRFASKNLGEI